MPTEVEIVGRREVPGLNADNPRELYTVIFYRVAGDPARADNVALPSTKATDTAIRDAIAAKERAKGASGTRRISID